MIRKFILLVAVVLGFTATQLSAQKAVITFDKKTHDFGTIQENGGNVSYVFEFTNTGDAPLLIQRVNASCGCTTPEWTQTPVEPGKKGSVKAMFNPRGRSGVQTKDIYVYSNASNEMERLSFTCTIERNAEQQNNNARQNQAANYPIEMGQLKANTKVAQFGNVLKNETQVRTINVFNGSSANLNLSFADVPGYINVSATPASLKANDSGIITVTVDAAKATEWGAINDNFTVVLNGKRNASDAYKVNVQANIIEDFSKMTAAQKRNAPIIEVKSYNLYMGNVKQGNKVRGRVAIKNVGINPLELRRVVNNNSDITIHPMRMSIRGGRTENFRIDIDSRYLPKGEYKKAFTVQTNDPINTYVTFTIIYKVI